MIIKCTAPIRICDLGGWTDTWFSGRGKILNIAVFPFVEVTVAARKRVEGESRITIFAENYGDTYDIVDGQWSRHPLIEAACQAFALPEEMHLDVSIYSDAPSGASTGTSAAVSVAVIGALDLIKSKSLTSYEIARKSHYLETEVLGYQAGIQDQLCSAYGGINFIEMEKYPEAAVSPIFLGEEKLWDLESRLMLVYLGKPHFSSAVHTKVIERLERSPEYREKLTSLRQCALHGKEALLQGDLRLFGEVMIANTEAQRSLHPSLVGKEAQTVIDAAMDYGVHGYKVNGAGGAGGSVTILLKAGLGNKRGFAETIADLNPDFRCIPITLAPNGLRRWSA
ncbi:MAG: hypothetical protein WD490_03820 [Opitutales bacterium]